MPSNTTAEARSYDELAARLLAIRDLSNKIDGDAQKDGRELTPRESARIEALFREFEEVEAEMVDLPEAHQTPAHLASARIPSAGRKTNAEAGGPAMSFVGGKSGEVQPVSPRKGVVFASNTRQFSAQLFGQASAHGDQWAGNTADFFNAVATRTFDPRLIRNIGGPIGQESFGADGGFDVPTIWYNGVVDQSLQQAEFAQRCRIFPATSNSLIVPMIDNTRQDEGVGSILANWSGEAQDQSPQVLKWRTAELKLNKTFILSEASSELVEDGISYQAQLTEAMSIATAQRLDAGILYGTGVGMPLGIINSASAIEIPKAAGQAADTVTWGNLVAMWARMTAASRKRATWFISGASLPSLMSVKVEGTNQPALLSGGFNDAGAGEPVLTIFGRPVVTTDIALLTGDKGDIVLADLSQYALLMKRSARLETDAGPGFSRDIQSFRMIMRVGGQPLWNMPITPFNGGPTLSWATYLAARA